MSLVGRLLSEGIGLQILSDCKRGLETLMAHKLRSLLTMLGMIFGVAAVVSMMSIGAGAQQQVLAFIEQLGVRNLIVEARESTDWQVFQKTRKMSPGLTERDLRVIRANVPGINASTARKRYVPQKLMPQPQREAPQVFGVRADLPRHRRPFSRAGSIDQRRRRRVVRGRGRHRRRREDEPVRRAQIRSVQDVKVNEVSGSVMIGVVGPQVELADRRRGRAGAGSRTNPI